MLIKLTSQQCYLVTVLHAVRDPELTVTSQETANRQSVIIIILFTCNYNLIIQVPYKNNLPNSASPKTESPNQRPIELPMPTRKSANLEQI